MAERTAETIIKTMNHELGKTLERWKHDNSSVEEMESLNTIFNLAEKAGIEMILEVKKGAIERERWDDFVRILHAELVIYGEEKENSWFFKVQPASREKGTDAHVLYASDSSGDPKLTFYHMNHGADGHFLPLDIISIKLQ
jgi:hypothetical protein